MAVADAASCTFSCDPIEIKDDSGLGGGTNVGVGETAAGFASRGAVVTIGLVTGGVETGVAGRDSKFTCGGATVLDATDPSDENWTPQ
jgi:hypothetical protein